MACKPVHNRTLRPFESFPFPLLSVVALGGKSMVHAGEMMIAIINTDLLDLFAAEIFPFRSESKVVFRRNDLKRNGHLTDVVLGWGSRMGNRYAVN